MLPLIRLCLPAAIAVALALPGTAAEAQQRQVAAEPAPPPKPKHGSTPPPIACAQARLVGLDAGQTGSIGFWIRAQGGDSGPATLQFSCKLDRTRILVGLTSAAAEKDAPPRHAVHVVDLSLDPPPARVVYASAVEAPVVIVRPGGGLSLVFADTVVDKDLNRRSFRAVDIATGKPQTVFSRPVEAAVTGCPKARALGAARLIVSVESALVDLGDEGGPYGIAITHVEADCKSGKTETRVDTFIAVPDGFEEFK